jgi:3-methyladenine DNA glycosylase AlkC
MITLTSLIERAQRSQHGFLDIQQAADEVFSTHSPADCLEIAHQLYQSEVHQARCLAVFILGRLASSTSECLDFLRQQVSRDADWRVQEILAKAFDRFCADTGYEQSLPVIAAWLADPHPNVRRAVSEGLRIWTGRPYFRDHPEAAVQFLSPLRSDESEYVRKSAGNALRDISKKHPALIEAELQQWDFNDKRVLQTYKLASKFILKKLT